MSEAAVDQAMRVLHRNQLPVDERTIFLACPQKTENYYALWTRDAMVSLIGALTTDDQELHQTARQSWQMLMTYQTQRGLIPTYISFTNPSEPKVEFGGWGRIETLDSQLWYVIGAWQLFKATQDSVFLADAYLESYERALELLAYRSYQTEGTGLVDWPVSSGWDDQMHRRHHILSLESLRILAFDAIANLLEAAGRTLQAELYRTRMAILRASLRKTFWLTDTNVGSLLAHTTPDSGPGYFSADIDAAQEYVHSHPPEFFQSYLAPYEITVDHLRRFDTYGNIMAILAGVAEDHHVKKIFNYIDMHKVAEPGPVRVLDPAIQPGDRDFHPFYEKARNKPYMYQNGAIWPHISGLYVMACKKVGEDQRAEQALIGMINLLSQPGLVEEEWGFNEYYHGQTGLPGFDANDHQAWSAAGLLYAIAAVNGKEPL